MKFVFEGNDDKILTIDDLEFDKYYHAIDGDGNSLVYDCIYSRIKRYLACNMNDSIYFICFNISQNYVDIVTPNDLADSIRFKEVQYECVLRDKK